MLTTGDLGPRSFHDLKNNMSNKKLVLPPLTRVTPAEANAVANMFRLYDYKSNGLIPNHLALKLIKSIGLYRSKAKNILKTCAILIEQHQSTIPNNRSMLEALPGVGRKTANVVLNTAFGRPTMAVDTHIFRLANRIPLAKGKNVNEVEKKLLRVIPKEYLQDAHHWIILHGRYMCTAQKPKCRNCIIYEYCEFKDKEKYI